MLISEFADKIAVSRADVENWTSRLTLSTNYAPTKRGVARQYTRENVLELALMAALTRIGMPASQAAEFLSDLVYVEDGIEKAKDGLLKRVLGRGRHSTWAGFFNHDDGFWGVIYSDEIHSRTFDRITHIPPFTVSVVHIARIIETVDQLFANREPTDG